MARLKNLILREWILYVRHVLLQIEPCLPRWVSLVHRMGPDWMWFSCFTGLLLLIALHMWIVSAWSFVIIFLYLILVTLEFDRFKRISCLPSLHVLVLRSETLLAHPTLQELSNLRHWTHEWLVLVHPYADEILLQAQHENKDKARMRSLYRYSK